ncbi:Zip-domain-containing protein [Aaosphaeria arxii CBS 175.79]|uniref:Zip-domain-containing protein n=1 Tax=Aaosphaeria arxii CBS 175.79 TaxID=1450172 RepID=A0A6A5XM60_9PLEO|nr:Zip-domain-containing protein [Aaosphaeria arxii CBS 175.79]KAF2013959.1 Zip-domain-containing protein [Aaosphaeria arxii CBS 175.79]
MNCPSRTEDDLFHPDWNQNPPRFAPDLTTCEDMGYIANARELGDAARLRAGYLDLDQSNLDASLAQLPDNSPPFASVGDKCPPQGPCTHLATNAKYHEYQAGHQQLPPRTWLSTCKGWASWLLSVLFTSAVLTLINQYRQVGLGGMSQFISGSTKNIEVSSVLQHLPNHGPSASPSSGLLKRDGCATGGAGPGYNLSLHVGALFIILFVSTTGCAFPVLVLKFPRLRIPATFLFSVRHFGTGVLIATAFVHLLPTAFISLGNPCLSDFWTERYQAMPGAIALAAIFFVTLVEMVFSPGRHACGSNEGVTAVSRGTHNHNHQHAHNSTDPDDNTGRRDRAVSPIRSIAPDETMRTRGGPLRGRHDSISRTLSRMGEESQALDIIEFRRRETLRAEEKTFDYDVEDSDRNQPLSGLTPEQEHKKAVMQCFLLEMGILFHSIFIGMSLSVSVGSEFVILLIAIIFHQTFEGLALGARISMIDWPEKAIQPWIMALAYGCTTPLGQAIGIATHTLYSPDSEIGLIVVGVMNAISAGLLVFASLVELMSEDFLSDASWHVLRGKKRFWACVLVFMGAFLMSLVGAWA